ncbi:MAG: 2-iminoacetate synthase ThiH [Desulfovibrio sp.]|jgi:2-iminoacetate synthase|nr:2-iminoacetate synthase ThiH [Desulfovibrio sp.]
MSEENFIPLADGFFHQLADKERVFAAAAQKAENAGREDVRRAIGKSVLDEDDFALLTSPAASLELEALAERAQSETLRRFGRAKQLFAPLYLGNYCTNSCVYCGFHAGPGIKRKALSPGEIEAELKALAATGLRQVLLLTGDAPKRTGGDYIARAVDTAARYFPSVGIEVQALTLEEYARIAKAGAGCMTMFQETYDRRLYARLHPAGPKRVFANRLDAPQRALTAGIRQVNFGVLLGLGDWRFDVFMMAAHARFLQRRFPEAETAFSLPRLRPVGGRGNGGDGQVFVPSPVKDRDFVQALTALRCFVPQAGITLSTRESAFMRDKLLPLGVTKISAGVCTGVGGYARPEPEKTVQFVIDDGRSVDEMRDSLEKLGFQPVFSDWLLPGTGELPLSAALRRSLGDLGHYMAHAPL